MPVHADVPPTIWDEQIEGAQGTSDTPAVASSHPDQLPQVTLEKPAWDIADDALKTEKHYGNPDITDDDAADHNVVGEMRRSWIMTIMPPMKGRTWWPGTITS